MKGELELQNIALQDVSVAVAKNRRKSIWKRIVSVLACIVVFCTTYALILPALTLERDPSCGIEEHTHTEACYVKEETPTEQVLVCTAETLGLHIHTDACIGLDGEYICGYSDFVVHSHNEFCFDENGVLVCTLPEIFPHTHTDGCYLMSDLDPVLSGELGGIENPIDSIVDGSLDNAFDNGLNNGIDTGLDSAAGHIHTDDCYITERGELICTMPEATAHVHTDECYLNTNELTCPLIEGEGHIHGEGCFDEAGALICTMPESAGHTHTPECYQSNSALICTIADGEQGHVHTDDCYAQNRVLVCEIPEEPSFTDDSSALPFPEDSADGFAQNGEAEGLPADKNPENSIPENNILDDNIIDNTAETDGRGEPICGMTEIILHRHDDSCFDENGALICGMTEVLEHIHTQDCMGTSDSSDDLVNLGYIDNADELTCTIAKGEGAHVHTAEGGCFDADGNLICELEESEGHVHSTICYGNWILVCGMEEHTHTDECYPSDEPEPEPDSRIIICGMEEHVHADECIDENGAIVCGIEEHTHAEECYLDTSAEREAFCGKLEHTHGEECIDSNGVISCGIEEHTHGEECYVDTSAELETFCGKVEHTHAAECFDENGMMICILEEHLHGEECYLDTSDELDTFCGKVEHTHSFECYDDDCALICLLEEHIHTEICYTEKTVEEILGFEPLATAYLVEVNLLEQPLMMSAVQAMPREAGAETDFTNYITKVTLQYNENNSWKDAPADYVIKKGEQVRFKLDYMLPARKLQGENNTIKYQLPDAFKNVDLTGGNVYNGATKIGSFTVSNDNTVHIEFLPTYVESNETGNAIIGDVIIKAEINEGKFDGDKVNIDFGNNLKVEYDFDRSDKDWSNATPEKTGAVIDRANGIIKYTIKVKTDHNGTTNPVSVKDTMEGVELVGGVEGITVTLNDQNVPCTPTLTANGFEINDLPKMAANTEYIITYNAKLSDMPTDSTVDIGTNNNVVVSTRRNDDTIIENRDDFPLTIGQNYISKVGALNGDQIDWKITINDGKHDISGWELRDELNGVLLNKLPLEMKDSNGNIIKIDSWPYRFPDGSNGTYTIEYSTPVTPKLEASEETNKATIGKPNEKPAESIAVVPLPELDPVSKNALSVVPSGDGTADVSWKVTITADKGDIPANWYYEDWLNYGWQGDQYITEGQFNDLCKAIEKAIPKEKYNYTVSRNTADGKIRGFKIDFTTKLKKGESFTFVYSSTGVLTDSEREFGNKGSVNGKKEKWSWIKYYPALKKVDLNNENGGANTQHEYFDRDPNKVGVLSWKVFVSPPSDYESGDLKLIEHLPDGLTLTKISVQIQDLWWGGDITTAGEHIIKDNPRLTCQTEIRGNDIIITIPEDVVKIKTPNKLNFEVHTRINDDAEFGINADGLPEASFANTAELTYGNGTPIDTKTQTQTVTKDDTKPPISKSYGTIDDNIIPYTVMVNPDGLDLVPDTEYLDFVDTIKLRLSDKNDPYVLKLDETSLHVYKINNDGSEAELNMGSLKSKIESGVDSDNGGNNWFKYSTISMRLPDSTPLKIVYSYGVISLNKEFNVNKSLQNEASISGVSTDPQDSKKDVSFNMEEITASGATGGVEFVKVDADNYFEVLKDVEFELYCYGDDGEYYRVMSDKDPTKPVKFKPDAQGKIIINNVPFNRACYLVETVTPAGYFGLKDYWYFLVEDPAGKTPLKAPADFDGRICQGGNTYYIPNEKKTTEIEVIKRWHDKDGKDITSTRQGNIHFELRRYILDEDPGSKPQNVNINCQTTQWPTFTVPTYTCPYGSTVTLTMKTQNYDQYNVPDPQNYH